MVWQFFVVWLVMAAGVISFLRIQDEQNRRLRGDRVRTSSGIYAISVLGAGAVLALFWFILSNINVVAAIFYVAVRLLTTVGLPAVIFVEIRRISTNPANNPDPTQLYHKYMWLAWLDFLPLLLILWWSSSWCTYQGNVGVFFRLLLWFCTGLVVAMEIESRFRLLSWIRLALLAVVSLVACGFLFFGLPGGWVMQLIFMCIGPVMVPITFGYAWSRWVSYHLADESDYTDESPDETGEETPPASAGTHSTTGGRHMASSGNGPNGTRVRRAPVR